MTAREAASISSHFQVLQSKADLLRSTAMELRAGKINAFHAANRLDRIARELAKERK